MSEQQRTNVIRLMREMERDSLAHLSGEPTERACTTIAIARGMYQEIEFPPTEDREFYVRTYWKPDPWRALFYAVFVKRGRNLEQVVGDRAGLFGDR